MQVHIISTPDTEKRNRTYFKKKIKELEKEVKELKKEDPVNMLGTAKFMLSFYRSQLRKLIKSGKRELPPPEPVDSDDEEVQYEK